MTSTNDSVGRENARLSRNRKKLSFVVTVLTLICFAGSLILFVFAIFDLSYKNSTVRFAIIASVLLVVGLALIVLVRPKRLSNDSQATISTIPVEVLATSPAPFLPHSHIPRRLLSLRASSMDLPDYFTAVQNIDGIYLSEEDAVWIKRFPETPPPCYDDALKLAFITGEESSPMSLVEFRGGEETTL